MIQSTFIIDCPICKAKVAAFEKGSASKTFLDHETEEMFGTKLFLGSCPSCDSLLAGVSHQLDFEGYDAIEDRWSDVVRVYPKPPKSFLSLRIPKVVKDSLAEADLSLQVNANIAACVMLGRALEAVCRDILMPAHSTATAPGTSLPKQNIMLGKGIKELKDKGVIDERLYNWSQQLHAFRNLGAHPEDISITREDAEDLQSFIYAIVEYIYDLTDRYEEFKARMKKKSQKKRTST